MIVGLINYPELENDPAEKTSYWSTSLEAPKCYSEALILV